MRNCPLGARPLPQILPTERPTRRRMSDRAGPLTSRSESWSLSAPPIRKLWRRRGPSVPPRLSERLNGGGRGYDGDAGLGGELSAPIENESES